MAIFLKNPMIIEGAELPVPSTETPIQTPVRKNTMPPRIAPGYNAEEHHILVVNGKEKKVSKKSAYLLDMLIVDDK
jgi:hypothetical protein